MGHLLLWVEGVTACLLLVALLAACAARLRRRWLRLLLPVSAAFVLALVGTLASVVGILMMRMVPIHSWLFYGASSWTVSFVIGTVVLLRRGLRRGGAAGDEAARAWPRGKLAIAAAAAFLLCATTHWNTVLMARTRLAALRAEAGAMALSVALPRPPDSENAAPLYEKAFDLMERGAELPERAEEVPDKDLGALLAGHEDALRILRRAAAMPSWYVEEASASPDPAGLVDKLAPMRRGARLLALDARLKSAQGDADVALADVAALSGMARHAAAGPMLMQCLVATAIGKTTHSALQAVLANTEPDARALTELPPDETLSYWRAYRRSLRMEMAIGLSGLPPVAGGLGDAFFLQTELPAYRRGMEELQQLAARPYHESREGLERLAAEAERGEHGVFFGMLLPALQRMATEAAQADARHGLDNLALAAAAFRAKYDRLPARAEDLVPEFLMLYPEDPFDGAPMRMVAENGGLLFYSIGADLKDDAGAEWDAQERAGDLSFRLGPPPPE